MNRQLSTMSALVLGAGSIGSRHARNLRAAGVGSIAIYDAEASAAARLAAEIGGNPVESLDAWLAVSPPTVGLVCTPPHLHVEQALKLLEHGAHVFVEKPLSHTSAEAARLAQIGARCGRAIQVGYNLRFHPGLILLKEFIDAKQIGRIFWARLEVGQYLPDWRPQADYRRSYTASSARGGGILLDASHEIDYACWLFGAPVELCSLAGRSGVLEMDAEDCASLIMRCDSGVQVDIHLDCLQRTYTRQCKVVGELGTLVWDYTLNDVRLWQVSKPEWLSHPYSFEGNDMYRAELDHFLASVVAGTPPAVGIADGLRAIRIVEAAKQAAAAAYRVTEV